MRIVLVAVLAFGLLVAPARADIQLIDPATGAATTLLADESVRLVGRVGDQFLVQSERAATRLAIDGSRTPAPELFGADSIGPDGQTVRHRGGKHELHAPDGRLIKAFRWELYFTDDPNIAWSRDGARWALITSGELHVLESATGAVVLERPAENGQLDDQAFAPDGAALVYTNDQDAFRVDFASGTSTKLGRADRAAWGGSIALTRRRSIAVLGAPGFRIEPGLYTPARWSPDGATLAYVTAHRNQGCSYPPNSLMVAAPGGQPRTLIPPTPRGLRAIAWTVDGRLVLDRQPEVSTVRGTRHPWPKRVATRFGYTHDAAVRRIVLRAARSLKAGAEREPVLARVRRDMTKLQAHDNEIGGSWQPIGDELDRWLHAAGFERTDGPDEYVC